VLAQAKTRSYQFVFFPNLTPGKRKNGAQDAPYIFFLLTSASENPARVG
jgi:hypothetical protein